jgi:hypothetical protein
VKVNYLPPRELLSVVGHVNENKTKTKSPGCIAAVACCCGVIHSIGDHQTVRRATLPFIKHFFFQRKYCNMKDCNI